MMFKKCCLCATHQRGWKRDCCSLRNCNARSNSFGACRPACRDSRNLVHTCNLERRLELTSSNSDTFLCWFWTSARSHGERGCSLGFTCLPSFPRPENFLWWFWMSACTRWSGKCSSVDWHVSYLLHTPRDRNVHGLLTGRHGADDYE